MAKEKRATSARACPRCRLVHSFGATRCRHCGDAARPVAIKALATRSEGRRLVPATPEKRGVRFFDGIFFVLCFALPFDAQRRDPSWVVPMLMACIGAWALFRLAHFFVTHFRLARVEGPQKVSSVLILEGGEREGASFSGRLRRLKDTVNSEVAARRVLASASSLRPRGSKGRVILHGIAAASFVVESEEGVRVVEGHLRVEGEAKKVERCDEGWTAFGGVTLDPCFFVDASLYEVALEGRDEVAIWGGVERRGMVPKAIRGKGRDAEISILEGVLGNPVVVELLSKARG